MFHVLFGEFIEPVPESGCWLWLGYWNPKNYPIIRKPPYEMKRAHRKAYEMTYGAIPEGMQVCHKCDTRPCVNPEHLFLGTNQDNVDDRNRKGRQARGERHSSSRLTEAMVLEIRGSSESAASWSRRTGISVGSIKKARRGETWGHVPRA